MGGLVALHCRTISGDDSIVELEGVYLVSKVGGWPYAQRISGQHLAEMTPTGTRRSGDLIISSLAANLKK